MTILDGHKLIGIAGTDGAGKDSLGEYLARHGWLFISVTELLRAEARKRGHDLSRPVLRQISTEWRRQDGLGVLVDKAVADYKDHAAKYRGLVIASLRNPGEADRVHELGGQVVWVDADPLVRYGRISSRNRGNEDKVTFEEFLAEEKAQMQHHSGDQTTLNLSGVKAKADVFLDNNTNDLKKFESQAAQALGL